MEELSLFDGEEYKYMFLEQQKQSLNDKFIIPPFSVFDTRQGYWLERRNKWNNLGIKSELGRGEGLTFNPNSFNYEDDKIIQELKKYNNDNAKCLPKGFDEEKYGVKQAQATSIFDPVLTEICYRWFCPEGG